MSRYEFTPYPASWYRLAHSDEIKKGQITSVGYLGREFLVYRDDAGSARVTDPFCPHLGAHLGVGGKIDAGRIVCPFHGWAFDGSGDCVDIPYCDKIPSRAKLSAFEVREANGLIFVWWDPAGREPLFEIPELRETGDGPWKRHTTLRWKFRSHIQEIIENGVDFAHFNKLHQFLELPTGAEVATDGPRLHLGFDTKRRLLGMTAESHMTADFWGMGFYNTPVQAGGIDIDTYMTPTPVDDETIEVCLDVMFRRSANPAKILKNQLVHRVVTKGIKDEFERDIKVWEAKAYRTNPGLCRDDGPIMKVRNWCEQFYPEGALESVS